MKLDLHYVGRRLVARYASDIPRGADTDFYFGLAAELGARRILDLGCGTGLLTREPGTAECLASVRRRRCLPTPANSRVPHVYTFCVLGGGGSAGCPQ